MSNIADEKYVVLTTTKKNGQTVPTPVWIAPLPDGSLGFTTELTSGKVKRIRNFPDVTLQASNVRGVVKPGSSPVTARASVLTGDDVTECVGGARGLEETDLERAYQELVQRALEETQAVLLVGEREGRRDETGHRHPPWGADHRRTRGYGGFGRFLRATPARG